MNITRLFQSTLGEFSAKNYDKIVPLKQGPYEVTAVDESTFQITQQKLEDIFSMHLATSTVSTTRSCK